MTEGLFYFLTDEYYDRFPKSGLMKNKEADRGRPCYYCFEYDNVSWMIPISSQIEKYQKIFNKKKQKYRNYYGIRFGYVLGKKRAFLLQNICPVTSEYIEGTYMNKVTNLPVTIDPAFAAEIERCAKQILVLHRKNISAVLTDINYILQNL